MQSQRPGISHLSYHLFNSNRLDCISIPPRRDGYAFFLFILVWLVQPVIAQNQVPRDEQYKIRPTNAMAAIAMGKVDDAITNLSALTSDFPIDAESHYCLAGAYSAREQINQAVQHMTMALDLGMPLERFLAGPASLLKYLTNSDEFKQLIVGIYRELIHGPMLGDLTSSSAKIWMRTYLEKEVTVEVIKEMGKPGQRYHGITGESADFVAIIQISELEPETTYYYSVLVDGTKLFDGGHFTTPGTEGLVQFKIGFGGGAGYTPWFERMWDTLAAQKFDAFLLLGDNVYIDYPEVPEVQQYCYYRRQSRPEFRRFTANVPLYAIWDDHDFTINDGEGGSEIEVPVWKRPVWEVFKQQWPNPYYGGGKNHPGCWHDFSISDVDFMMLHCRYYRENPQMVDDPSMLGDYQKKWLKEKLRTSTATFKVVASSVPWAEGTKPGCDDTWDGFPDERKEIFSFIVENKIEGVILISADRHRSDAWKVPIPNGYTTYDLMSSRLTNIHTHNLMDGCLFGYNKKCSFGIIEFDTTIEDPTLTYTIKSIDNETIHQMTIFRSQLDFERNKVKNKRGRP